MRRSWICRCATCWRDIARTRAAPPVMRASIRSAWRSRVMGRSVKGARKDLAGRPVETQAVFPGGSPGRRPGRRDAIHPRTSPEGLRRKSQPQIAGICAGPLAATLRRTGRSSACRAKLAANGYRFAPLVEAIVTSPQFLHKRRIGYNQNRKVTKDVRPNLEARPLASPAARSFAAPGSPWHCRGWNPCPFLPRPRLRARSRNGSAFSSWGTA